MVSATRLPDLPYDGWESTKATLHRYVQIVGKIKLAITPYRNHWWNVPLYVNVRGLTTGLMFNDGESCAIDFDFIDDIVLVRRSDGGERPIALRDGLSVSDFYAELFTALEELALRVIINPAPYGLSTSQPLDRDNEHRTYDADAVRRWWSILQFSADAFLEYSGRFTGKTSPVHVFWHSFDLAVTRFNGRAAPARPGANRVEREAYSHEVISAGFWPGDEQTRFPAYYVYAAPEPPRLTAARLAPFEASWEDGPGGTHLALLPYDDVRAMDHPRSALLQFLQSGYDAAAAAAGWDGALRAAPAG